MKNNIWKVLLVVVLIGVLLGAYFYKNSYNSEFSKEFKDSYEKLNGKKNKDGKEYRTIKIDANNPFEKVDAKKIVKKIENKETFYVYFGDEMCPWCRSVIEMAIKSAKENHINKIYYVDIWNEKGEEILRDKLAFGEDNELMYTSEGTKEYYKLLQYFDKVLDDYYIYDSEASKWKADEKRIFAPNFIYVKKGEAIKLTEGISDKQIDPRGKLTKEILKDEKKLFDKFFKN